jgi:hypothetical protein
MDEGKGSKGAYLRHYSDQEKPQYCLHIADKYRPRCIWGLFFLFRKAFELLDPAIALSIAIEMLSQYTAETEHGAHLSNQESLPKVAALNTKHYS